MRQEIIANKEAKEYKVIYNSLEVDGERRIWDGQFILQIFSQHPDVQEL